MCGRTQRPPRRKSRCCRRSSSSATCSGRCSTPSTTPMSSRGTCRPSPGSRRRDGACGRCPAAPRPRRPPAEDRARGGFVLLAPERVLHANGTAVEVLRLCDGERTVATLVDELAARFAADRERVAAEVAALLTDLAAKRMVEL